MNQGIRYCRILKSGVYLNGHPVFRFESTGQDENLLMVYRSIGVDYPKFYKMDRLARAAFLAIEMLKGEVPELLSHENDSISLIFANTDSSAEADQRFRHSYQAEKLPSPSLFVYTLPNIALGEIAIRNKWHGEQLFAVFPNFAPAFYENFGSLSLKKGAESVICGWVNVKDEFDVLVFLLEKSNIGPDTRKMLERLYVGV